MYLKILDIIKIFKSQPRPLSLTGWETQTVLQPDLQDNRSPFNVWWIPWDGWTKMPVCGQDDSPSVSRYPLERVHSRGKTAGRFWTPVGLPACITHCLIEGAWEVLYEPFTCCLKDCFTVQSIIACDQTFNTAVTVKKTLYMLNHFQFCFCSFTQKNNSIIQVPLFCFFPLNLQKESFIGHHDGGEQKRV